MSSSPYLSLRSFRPFLTAFAVTGVLAACGGTKPEAVSLQLQAQDLAGYWRVEGTIALPLIRVGYKTEAMAPGLPATYTTWQTNCESGDFSESTLQDWDESAGGLSPKIYNDHLGFHSDSRGFWFLHINQLTRCSLFKDTALGQWREHYRSTVSCVVPTFDSSKDKLVLSLYARCDKTQRPIQETRLERVVSADEIESDAQLARARLAAPAHALLGNWVLETDQDQCSRDCTIRVLPGQSRYGAKSSYHLETEAGEMSLAPLMDAPTVLVADVTSESADLRRQGLKHPDFTRALVTGVELRFDADQQTLILSATFREKDGTSRSLTRRYIRPTP